VPKTPIEFVRPKRICAELGISHSELYNKIAGGEFPPLIKLGLRASAAVRSELEKYKRKLIAARDARATYDTIRAGKFPAPEPLYPGSRAKGFSESKLIRYQRECERIAATTAKAVRR
jgi:predicted DNA-binding transcriptional regulator AlpA